MSRHYARIERDNPFQWWITIHGPSTPDNYYDSLTLVWGPRWLANRVARRKARKADNPKPGKPHEVYEIHWDKP